MVAWILVALSALVALGNVVGVLGAARRRRRGDGRGFSCVALLSLVLGLVAWAVVPGGPGAWALVPAALDPGTWVVLLLPWYLWRHRDDASA